MAGHRRGEVLVPHTPPAGPSGPQTLRQKVSAPGGAHSAPHTGCLLASRFHSVSPCCSPRRGMVASPAGLHCPCGSSRPLPDLVNCTFIKTLPLLKHYPNGACHLLSMILVDTWGLPIRVTKLNYMVSPQRA